MKIGSPPTAPKARAGLLTPPGITRLERWNASRLRTRLGLFMRGVHPFSRDPIGEREYRFFRHANESEEGGTEWPSLTRYSPWPSTGGFGNRASSSSRTDQTRHSAPVPLR